MLQERIKSALSF